MNKRRSRRRFNVF
uniref:Uncharacterized protein n=1 Tax=Anguilla anguilla TaxID=7936 RepID=A0A0E9TB11_ANGAN